MSLNATWHPSELTPEAALERIDAFVSQLSIGNSSKRMMTTRPRPRPPCAWIADETRDVRACGPGIGMGKVIASVADCRSFWRDIVVPDYNDFAANIADLRRAFHCAISLFHLSDWMYVAHKAYIDANFTFHDKIDVARPVSDEKTPGASRLGIQLRRGAAPCCRSATTKVSVLRS